MTSIIPTTTRRASAPLAAFMTSADNAGMRMKNPAAPIGLMEEVADAKGLTMAQVAARLDLTEAALMRMIEKEAPMSAEQALTCEKEFGVSADLLMRMQAAHDLAQARLRS